MRHISAGESGQESAQAQNQQQDQQVSQPALPGYINEDLNLLRETLAHFMEQVIGYISTSEEIDDSTRVALASAFPEGKILSANIVADHNNYKQFYTVVQEKLASANEFDEFLLDLSLIALPIALAAQSTEVLYQWLAFYQAEERFGFDQSKHNTMVGNIHSRIDAICASIQVLHQNCQELQREQKPIAGAHYFHGMFASDELIQAFIAHWKNEKKQFKKITLKDDKAVCADADNKKDKDKDDDDDNVSALDNALPPYDASVANTTNRHGDTLLHTAAKMGNEAVASTCLMLGCDPDKRNNEGFPAIAFALDKPLILRHLVKYQPKLAAVQVDLSLYSQYKSARLDEWRRKVKSTTSLESLTMRWQMRKEKETGLSIIDTQSRNPFEIGLDIIKAYQMLCALLDVKKRIDLLLNIENADIFIARAEIAYKKVQNDFLMLMSGGASQSGASHLFQKYQTLYDEIQQLTEDCQPFREFMYRFVSQRGEQPGTLVNIDLGVLTTFRERLSAHLQRTTDLLCQLEQLVENILKSNQQPLSPVVQRLSPVNSTTASPISRATARLDASAKAPPALPDGINRQRLCDLLGALQFVAQRNVLFLNAYLNYLVGLHLNGLMPSQFNLHRFMQDDAVIVQEKLAKEQTTEAIGIIAIKLFVETFNALPQSQRRPFVNKLHQLITCEDNPQTRWIEMDTLLNESKTIDGANEQVIDKCFELWRINKPHVMRYFDLLPDAAKRWHNIISSPSVANHPQLKQMPLSDLMKASMEPPPLANQQSRNAQCNPHVRAADNNAAPALK